MGNSNDEAGDRGINLKVKAGHDDQGIALSEKDKPVNSQPAKDSPASAPQTTMRAEQYFGQSGIMDSPLNDSGHDIIAMKPTKAERWPLDMTDARIDKKGNGFVIRITDALSDNKQKKHILNEVEEVLRQTDPLYLRGMKQMPGELTINNPTPKITKFMNQKMSEQQREK